ncbi:hypothetical protein SAMN02910353_00538 [Ruminococcus sp. YRD2003]|uniref:dockerin type I repeat-containing protein n=1 Tax=Ruminococcus sp. YRD2003 TaxID=1452313 RepID=UPI0008AB2EFE|nr:hypothetical protein SAMN02910353_00538 [Ruminococcus flavefaciens]
MNVLKSIVPFCLSAALIVQSVPSFTAHGEVFADDLLVSRVGDLTFRYIPDLPRKGECTLASVSDSSDNITISSHDTLEIPEKLGRYTVTALGSDSNSITRNPENSKVKLTTVRLPHSIREIHAFSLHEDRIPFLDTVYIDFAELDQVERYSFGYTPRLGEVCVYDAVDDAYYPTSDDIDKFRELVSIEGVRFSAIPEISNGYMLAESEYRREPSLNGRLEFLNELGQSKYEYNVALMYAEEITHKYGFDDPALSKVQKMEMITNFIRANTRYSVLYTYDADPEKAMRLENLKNSPTSAIAFHSAVCGGLAYEFDILSRVSIGDETATRDRDLLCVRLPGHVVNAVRVEHTDDNKGYYVVDNTLAVFMQCAGDAASHFNDVLDTYLYDYMAYYSDEHNEIEVVKDTAMFCEGISFVFLHDETEGALHIEMCEKNSNGAKDLFNIMSYDETEPETFLEQTPLTKYPRTSGMNLYIDKSKTYDMIISNSKGRAVFSADGVHDFTLGDTEYQCSVSFVRYNTPTKYGIVNPHTSENGYFDITIKQLSEDPSPDAYTTTTVPHRSTTTTTVSAPVLYGDANCDGRITASDAVTIMLYIGNKDKYPLTPQGKLNADCNNVGDGITANDALAIQKYDAKVIDSLPEFT